MTIKRKATIRLGSSSVETLRIPVHTEQAGVQVNITTSAVSFAYVAQGTEPVTGDYKVGSWDTEVHDDNITYWAQSLVGSAGADTDLAEGTYSVWIRLVRGNDDVRREVATLIVT